MQGAVNLGTPFFTESRSALKLAAAPWLSIPSPKVEHVGSGSGCLTEFCGTFNTPGVFSMRLQAGQFLKEP